MKLTTEVLDGEIWQIATDGLVWAVLLRSGQTASLQCLENKKVSTRPVSVEWWSSLVGVANGIAILTTFPDPKIPQTIGITAYSTQTGAQLWHHPALQPGGVYTNGVVAYWGEKSLFLDLNTGESKQEKPVESPTSYFAPEPYLPDENYYDVLAAFMKKAGITPEGQIAYLENHQRIILQDGAGWLLVCDRQGAALHKGLYKKGHFMANESETVIIWSNRIAFLG